MNHIIRGIAIVLAVAAVGLSFAGCAAPPAPTAAVGVEPVKNPAATPTPIPMTEVVTSTCGAAAHGNLVP